MIERTIRDIVEGRTLSRDAMRSAVSRVMDGEASEVQKTAMLVGLKLRGETAEEITGAAEAMRERVVEVGVGGDDLVDTCGTGGDGSGSFNISTVAGLVAAAAGVKVAKHGNRAVSSKCGSADVLAALGARIDLDAAGMQAVLDRVGFSFLFAPALHPAMAAVMAVRRELGTRTIFNILGPLTNPARAKRQVIGVFSRDLVPKVGEVLLALGATHALVVHSEDGMDEISVSAPTDACEVRAGAPLRRFRIDPGELGLERSPRQALQGGSADENARIVRRILEGERGARRDVVLANAGAAIYVGGAAGSIREGVDRARRSIDRGEALQVLDDLVAATRMEGAA